MKSTLRRLHVYTNPRFLDPEACHRIRSAMDRGHREPAEILQEDMALVPEVRRAFSIDADRDTVAEVEARLDSERGAIAAFFAIALGQREGVSFLRYEAGGFYKPHRDRGRLPSWPAAARRRVSVVVFLNGARETPSAAEFSGGELRLLGSERLEIRPRPGWLIAFPATMPHEVAAVRRGTRDTLVDWFS